MYILQVYIVYIVHSQYTICNVQYIHCTVYNSKIEYLYIYIGYILSYMFNFRLISDIEVEVSKIGVDEAVAEQ